MCANPWEFFNINAQPFILHAESKAFSDANNKVKQNRKLRDDCLPEPFIGCNKAPIYFLLANPGFENHVDNGSMLNNPQYQQAVKDNLAQKCDVRYPFYYLDPVFTNNQKGGHKWWRSKLEAFVNDLVGCGEDFKKGKVMEELPHKIFALELYGYHSERFNEYFIGKNSPSLAYAICLVKKAIEEDKTIFILRRKNLWLELVPELLCYKHCYFAVNTRQIHITRRNLSPAAFERAKGHF